MLALISIAMMMVMMMMMMMMYRDEYMCALYKKILLQGKMFVFDSYICFHANVFGCVTHLRASISSQIASRLIFVCLFHHS